MPKTTFSPFFLVLLPAVAALLSLGTAGCGRIPGETRGDPVTYNPGPHPIVIIDTEATNAASYTALPGEAPTVVVDLPYDLADYGAPAADGTYTPLERDVPEGPVPIDIKNPGPHQILVVKMGPAPKEAADKAASHTAARPMVIVRTNNKETPKQGNPVPQKVPLVVINLPENYPTPPPSGPKKYRVDPAQTNLVDVP